MSRLIVSSNEERQICGVVSVLFFGRFSLTHLFVKGF